MTCSVVQAHKNKRTWPSRNLADDWVQFHRYFVYDRVQAILSVLNASVAAESGGACVLDPVTSALLPINTQSAGANKSPNITDDAGEGAKR